MLLKLFAGTFGCLYKGAVRGLFEDQPRKKVEVSIKALQGMLADEKKMDNGHLFFQEKC